MTPAAFLAGHNLPLMCIASGAGKLAQAVEGSTRFSLDALTARHPTSVYGGAT